MNLCILISIFIFRFSEMLIVAYSPALVSLFTLIYSLAIFHNFVVVSRKFVNRKKM